MKKIFGSIVFISFVVNVISQDFHLAQYDNVIQYLNPAYVGYDLNGKKENYRAAIDNRTQWGAITSKPYRNFLFSYDQVIDKQFSVGGHFISNNSGFNNINTFNLMLAGSYNIIQSPISEHKLKAGLQMGIFHRYVGYEGYLYDDQYNTTTGAFDADIQTNENFQKNFFTRFDAGLGIYYNMVSKKMFNPFGGLSLRHISFPNEAIALDKFTLPMHFMIHGGTGITINKEWGITPNVLYMYQKAAYEFNFGVMGQYNIRDTDYAVNLGLNYRLQDALIIQTGFKYKKSVIRFSYDINTSYLKNYTNNRGGFEFSIGYVGSFNETARLFKPSLR